MLSSPCKKNIFLARVSSVFEGFRVSGGFTVGDNTRFDFVVALQVQIYSRGGAAEMLVGQEDE